MYFENYLSHGHASIDTFGPKLNNRPLWVGNFISNFGGAEVANKGSILISQFLHFGIEKNVLWFYVTVVNTGAVRIFKSFKIPIKILADSGRAPLLSLIWFVTKSSS